MYATFFLSVSFSVLFSATLECSQALNVVNISNLEVRHDIHGREMDTHDGNIVRWEQGGLYYFYAMGYMNCTLEHSAIPPQDCPGIYKPFGRCGFRTDHAVRVYTSPDLQHWTPANDNALPISGRPYGIYYRPKVVFNKITQQYVLWINYLPNASIPLEAFPVARYVVAVSSSPYGPFSVVLTRAGVANAGGGDFALLVTPSNSSKNVRTHV